MSESPPSLPKFDPDAAHHQKPRLRPVRGFPAQSGEQTVLGLADARQISDKVVFTLPAAQLILPLMNGERSLDQIVSEVGRGLQREMLEVLVAQLDDAGLLFGPTFDELLTRMRRDFDNAPTLPPASTAAIAEALAAVALGEGSTEEQRAAEAPDRLREAFDSWIDVALKNARDPSFDALPRAIVAPHLDYQRGWMNYASSWGRMRLVDRPDRVIILGTNHFGEGTGVVGCDKGYQTPLGTCPIDLEVLAIMRRRLGDPLFACRYDHEREHSIELQVPWIQHVVGTDEKDEHVKVFGALVHDPAVNNGESYDGKGVALKPFVDAMREVITTLPGRTLVVASADLSHVGPSFGDRESLGDEKASTPFRDKTFSHDREMIELVRQNKPGELIGSMAWQQNPTRWCSTGNLVATLLAVEPTNVRVLNYAAAIDQAGQGMVSSVSMVME